jgi:hypothetical protein
MPTLKYTETRVQFPAPPNFPYSLGDRENPGKRDVFQGFSHFATRRAAKRRHPTNRPNCVKCKRCLHPFRKTSRSLPSAHSSSFSKTHNTHLSGFTLLLDDNDKGRHRKGSISVSITMKYRAIYVVEENVNVWYWIGTHNDFENFTGKK